MKTSHSSIMMKALFLQSLGRCSLDEQFVPTFYERFLDSSDDVREKFRHTSFENQNKMLLKSLQLAAGATSGDADALEEITLRTKTHDRNHLDIKPELYALWLEALISTARDFDKHWNASIEEAWRTIHGFVIRRMISKY